MRWFFHLCILIRFFSPQVSFEINIITPFEGVTLEIGGAVETYWKSLAVPHTAPAPSAKTATPRLSRARQLGSAPLGSPTGSPITVTSKAQPITISSITGSYVYITVQVTQDLQPVVFGEWQLPQQDFDLWVADVTLAQFEALARRKGMELRANGSSSSTNGGGVMPSTPSEWHSLIRRSMVSLEHLLKVCVVLAYFHVFRCIWTNHANEPIIILIIITRTHAHHHHYQTHAPVGPGPGGDVGGRIVLLSSFISLNFIIYLKITPNPPKKQTNKQNNKQQTTNQDHSGVNGPLPRTRLPPDRELLLRVRVQGRRRLLNARLGSAPASPAAERVHRLDPPHRLPHLRTAPGRPRRPAPNHIHLLSPRRMRRRQLEAAELSVIIPSPFPLLSSFYSFLANPTLKKKKPNLNLPHSDPVLFASSCGEVRAKLPSTTAAIVRSEATLDLRLTSVSAAVEFSKNNNLLGVLLDTCLLVCPFS